MAQNPLERVLQDIMARLQGQERRLRYLERIKVPDDPVNYTPTVTQSGTVTSSVAEAFYQIGRGMVFVKVHLDITGTGTAGNDISLSGLPAVAQVASSTGAFNSIGFGIVHVSGTGAYYCNVEATGVDTIKFRNDSSGNYLGTGPSVGLTNGSDISFTAVFKKN